MNIPQFLVLVGIVVILLFVYKYADKKIVHLNPKTVKTVNWIGFSIGAIGGILWYIFHDPIFMFITVGGVIIYFLFYGYDVMEEEEEKKEH